MAATIVATAVYQAPASSGSLSSRTITLPTGIQDGDLIIIAADKNGSANGFTLSGLTFTTLGTNASSGHWSSVHYKTGAASDSGVTVTATTSSAYRAALAVVVVRGVSGINAFGKSTTASGASVSAPAVTPTGGASVVRLDFACTSGGDGVGIAISTPAGMTASATAYDQVVAAGQGAANIKAATNLTPTDAAVSANTYTNNSTTAIVGTGWTLLLSIPVASTNATPSTLTSNAGSWTNQGGAADIPAALADASDATFAQSPATPSAASFQVKFTELAAGLVTVSYDADMDSGTGSCVVTLYQGATSIASWTDAWTTTKTTFTHTTSSGQAAAITDRSDLRVTFSLTGS